MSQKRNLQRQLVRRGPQLKKILEGRIAVEKLNRNFWQKIWAFFNPTQNEIDLRELKKRLGE